MANNVCSFCNSTWNTSKVFSECPFCGQSILIEDENSRELLNMGSLLAKLRDVYGVGVFANTNQAISIMRDFAPYLASEIKLFKIALDAKAYSIFCEAREGSISDIELSTKFRYVLEEEYFLNKKSIDAIFNWFEILLSNTKSSSKTTQNVMDEFLEKYNDAAYIKEHFNDVLKETIRATIEMYKKQLKCQNGNALPEPLREMLIGLKQIIDEKAIKAKMKKLYNDKDELFLKDNFEVIFILAYAGDSDAQFQIGKCFHLGIGVETEMLIAKDFYEKAAIQGNSAAMHNLGLLFEDLSLIDQAVKSYEKAIECGEVLSAYNLGVLYRKQFQKNAKLDNLIIADSYLERGVTIRSENAYSGEIKFLKYKYECALLAEKNIKFIYDHSNLIWDKKSKEGREKIKKCLTKQKYYAMIAHALKKLVYTKYNLDITKIEW